jgi:hypothetical protein
VLAHMAAVLAEFLAGALGSVTTKVVIFPFETIRVVLAVRKQDYKVRLVSPRDSQCAPARKTG